MVRAVTRDVRFDRLFDQHHQAVQRYCLRRVAWHEVNDVVADVFLAAWRRIGDIPSDHELPWLYGIAKNVIRNSRRSQDRRERLLRRIDGQGANHEPSAEVHVVRRLEEQMLLEALTSLPESDRELLRLKCWERLTNAEIAVSLGTSSHAVDMRVSRARRRLARELAQRETREARSEARRSRP
jgi:RNA polymerase sigma-70 factor, ECF subfamily